MFTQINALPLQEEKLLEAVLLLEFDLAFLAAKLLFDFDAL